MNQKDFIMNDQINKNNYSKEKINTIDAIIFKKLCYSKAVKCYEQSCISLFKLITIISIKCTI